jgi:hypothetical protein
VEATIPVMLLEKNDVNLAMTAVAIEAHVVEVVTEADAAATVEVVVETAADVAEIVVAEVEMTVVATADLVENDLTSTMTVVDQAQTARNDPTVMTKEAEIVDQGVQQVDTMAATADQVRLVVDKHSQ